MGFGTDSQNLIEDLTGVEVDGPEPRRRVTVKRPARVWGRVPRLDEPKARHVQVRVSEGLARKTTQVRSVLRRAGNRELGLIH